jgi:hypothetical protein
VAVYYAVISTGDSRLRPGIQGGLTAVLAFRPLLIREHHYQNRIRCRHADRHSRAHQDNDQIVKHLWE